MKTSANVTIASQGIDAGKRIVCRKRGISPRPGVSQRHCLGHNYLALAERHGAAVATLTEVVHIARGPDG